jgi:hypothetical protein
MGLAFLNKKSWHTGSFQNIEKVWQAEQEQKEKLRKMREAQRRLKEERHYEELKKLQIEAGLLPKSHAQRLDWMYEGGSIRNTSSEEFLLGKPFEEKDPEAPKPEWRPTMFKESTANTQNEEFTKVREDPMFNIMQEEQRRKQEILNNPIKMQELRKELEKMKQGKKHKKHKKHKHSKESSRSTSTDSSKERSRSPRREKSKHFSDRSHRHSDERSSKHSSDKSHKHSKHSSESGYDSEEYGLRGQISDTKKPLLPNYIQSKPSKKHHSKDSIADLKQLTQEELQERLNQMRSYGESLHASRKSSYQETHSDRSNKSPNFLNKEKNKVLNVSMEDRIRSL